MSTVGKETKKRGPTEVEANRTASRNCKAAYINCMRDHSQCAPTDPEMHSDWRRYSGTGAFVSHFDSLRGLCCPAEMSNLPTTVLQGKYLDSNTSEMRITRLMAKNK